MADPLDKLYEIRVPAPGDLEALAIGLGALAIGLLVVVALASAVRLTARPPARTRRLDEALAAARAKPAMARALAHLALLRDLGEGPDGDWLDRLERRFGAQRVPRAEIETVRRALYANAPLTDAPDFERLIRHLARRAGA